MEKLRLRFGSTTPVRWQFILLAHARFGRPIGGQALSVVVDVRISATLRTYDQTVSFPSFHDYLSPSTSPGWARPTQYRVGVRDEPLPILLTSPTMLRMPSSRESRVPMAAPCCGPSSAWMRRPTPVPKTEYVSASQSDEGCERLPSARGHACCRAGAAAAGGIRARRRWEPRGCPGGNARGPD